MGAEGVRETRSGVTFQGNIETAYRACLWSRLANRILLPLASFPASSPELLYDGTRTIDWASHLSADQTIAVDTHVSTSSITHSHYAAQKIKDAIVDSFTERGQSRPSVRLDQPDIQVNCYLFKDEATIYLDLSGTSLHQRNYRLDTGEAPLKENLAAAILLRARWPEMSASHGAFADLMCGSGTLVIEAALMAADTAPGLTRDHFGFLNWKKHKADIWERLIAEAKYRKEKGLAKLPVMLGFDADRRVIDKARLNAERAGVADKVSFVYQDLFNFRHDFPAHGLMATNPPYGRRLSESGELGALYKALGDVMKTNLVGWRGAVFTEDQALGKHLGLRAEKVHTLYNGAIVCKLIHFTIDPSNFYRDARLPRRLAAADLSSQADGFRNRLLKNLRQLTRWAGQENISCFRVYDADLPDYSAAIDVYSHAQSPEERWICIQEYEAPPSIDPARARIRTRELVTICQDVFSVDDDHLTYKTRARQRGESQYQRVENTKHFHEVTEADARLWVNFEDYLDTGLFLDHRPIRLQIGRESAGKDFLNLFSYTGAATIHAALGGARTTTSVDLSKTYLDWAGRNLELNGLRTNQHSLIHADCLNWLEEQRAVKKQGEALFDLIFLDPPTFSNSKRMDESLDVQRDQVRLIEGAMALLRPGGKLYFSTNLRSFKLNPGLADRFRNQDISASTIPFDFKRRSNIHYCWVFQHTGDPGSPPG